MKRIVFAALAASALVGAVAPANAISWNDFWWCAGAPSMPERHAYCKSIGEDWG